MSDIQPLKPWDIDTLTCYFLFKDVKRSIR